MTIKQQTFTKFIFLVLVALPIYQDSFLSKYLGAAGYCIIMPLSLIMFFAYICVNHKMPWNKHLRILFILGLWIIVASLVATFIWIILGNSINVVGEFLPYKAIKITFQYLSYPSYVALLIVCARKVGIDYYGKCSFFTLLLLVLICIIEQSTIPYAFKAFHFAGVFPYYRIRLLTTEASATTMMIFTYAGVSFYWAKNIKNRLIEIITVICLLILIAMTGSKSVLIGCAIYAFLYAIFSLKKMKKRFITGLIVTSIILILFAEIAIPRLYSEISNDISNYTSISTRLYTMIIGLLIGIVFPGGIGATYIGVFRDALAINIDIYSKIFPSFKLNEIMNMIYSNSDVALTVKSGILHYNMYWGIIGTILLFKDFVNLTKELREKDNKEDLLLIVLFWSGIMLITISLNLSFEFWLIYALILSKIETTKEVLDEQYR